MAVGLMTDVRLKVLTESVCLAYARVRAAAPWSSSERPKTGPDSAGPDLGLPASSSRLQGEAAVVRGAGVRDCLGAVGRRHDAIGVDFALELRFQSLAGGAGACGAVSRPRPRLVRGDLVMGAHAAPRPNKIRIRRF